MAYYTLEPWGYEFDSLQTGIIASTIANRHRSAKEKEYQPSDFIPKLNSQPVKKQSWEEQYQTFDLIAKAFNKKYRKEGK